MGDVAKEILTGSQRLIIVFGDGEELECKLLRYGRYELYVVFDKGRLLIQKHSIKYIKLRKDENEKAPTE